nr:synaptobrevin, longin-like domain protein [Tanacetum cinerariifolium]
MVAILEKGEFNTDFYPMVDFIAASPLRCNLKLRDEDGIVSIPDIELFENLTLMGYNISQNQKLTFQKGQFSHQWKYLIHTIMQCLSPKSTRFNEFSSNIATALVCLATNRTYNFSKMIFDGMVKNVNNKVNSPSFSGRIVPLFDSMLVHQGEGSGTPIEPHHTPFPDVTSSHPTTSSIPLPSIPTAPIPTVTQTALTPIIQYLRRARIAQSSALPTVAAEPASPVKDDSQGEACPTDSGFIANQDRATIAKSSTLPRETNVLTGSGFIPTAGPPATVISTGSEVGPTASQIVPRRKGKEVMVEELKEQQEREDMRMNEQIARDAEVARIHAEEEIHGMIDSFHKSNETVAKYLQEYQQFASDLPLEKKIELISDLVKYQEHYTKVEDFIPMGSKEEAERLKRKGINLEKEQVKKQKSSKEAPETETSTEEFTEYKIKEIMQLVPVEDVYVQALQVKHPIIDWKVHSEVKEYLSIRPALSDKEMKLWVELKRMYEPDPKDQLWTLTQNYMHAPVEWKLYDLSGVHHVTAKDKEIFMLVEKYYPLRRGLALVMISYRLQGENHSQMAEDLIKKIYNIANTPRKQSD